MFIRYPAFSSRKFQATYSHQPKAIEKVVSEADVHGITMDEVEQQILSYNSVLRFDIARTTVKKHCTNSEFFKEALYHMKVTSKPGLHSDTKPELGPQF